MPIQKHSCLGNRRHMVKKHANKAPTSVSVPPVRKNHYGAAGSLPKKVETVEYDKKLLEESQEVPKIYKLLQRMKQDNTK